MLLRSNKELKPSYLLQNKLVIIKKGIELEVLEDLRKDRGYLRAILPNSRVVVLTTEEVEEHFEVT